MMYSLVYTFFVTHYLDFAENLAQMYPNVKVHHFVVIKENLSLWRDTL
jgi:hypothetical protein